LYYAKAAFGCGFGWQPTTLVGFWKKQKQEKAKPKAP
jgi:hypothetical protein